MEVPNLKNSKGEIFYGIHFYSGLAQYQEPDGNVYRVYLNEDTLRKMDNSFAGKPIYVEHVDDVPHDVDEVRKEADGWVIESFFNSADGKHWVKFIVCSERGLRAVKNGMRLSNAYIPKKFAPGGLWNGINYQKEIVDGEFEHLAIVKEPRYEESVILTPEEFKKYNSDKQIELQRISNSKRVEPHAKKETKMGFNLFKRTKINSIDMDVEILLPKSGKTITLKNLIENAIESDGNITEKKVNSSGESAKDHSMANVDHLVKMHDGSLMKIKDMMGKYKSMCDDMEEMKKKKEDGSDMDELDVKYEKGSVESESVDEMYANDPAEEGDMDPHEEEVAEVESKEELKDDLLDNPESVVHDEEDFDEKIERKKKDDEGVAESRKGKDKSEKDMKNKKKKMNEMDLAIKAQVQEKVRRLKNANSRHDAQEFEKIRNEMYSDVQHTINLSIDKVSVGRSRYGS